MKLNTNNGVVETIKRMFAILNVSDATVQTLIENFSTNVVLGILQLCMNVGRVDSQKGRMDEYNAALLTIARGVQAITMVESTYHCVVVQRAGMSLQFQVQEYKLDPDMMAVLHAPRVQFTERNLDPNLLQTYSVDPSLVPAPNELEKAYEAVGDSAKSYKIQDSLMPVPEAYANKVEVIDLNNHAYLSGEKVFGNPDPLALCDAVELSVDLSIITKERATSDQFATALSYIRRRGDVGQRVGAGRTGSEPPAVDEGAKA